MTNEERNKIMDSERYWNGADLIDPTNREAIRECDRKARAFDQLCDDLWHEYHKETDSGIYGSKYTAGLQWVMGKITELLAPPKPKSKLMRLREWAENRAIYHPELLAEIDRLEAEE